MQNSCSASFVGVDVHRESRTNRMVTAQAQRRERALVPEETADEPETTPSDAAPVTAPTAAQPSTKPSAETAPKRVPKPTGKKAKKKSTPSTSEATSTTTTTTFPPPAVPTSTTTPHASDWASPTTHTAGFATPAGSPTSILGLIPVSRDAEVMQQPGVDGAFGVPHMCEGLDAESAWGDPEEGTRSAIPARGWRAQAATGGRPQTTTGLQTWCCLRQMRQARGPGHRRMSPYLRGARCLPRPADPNAPRLALVSKARAMSIIA